MKCDVPPVVIVRKTYPKFRKMQKHRLWKLKHLDKEKADEEKTNKKDKHNERYQRDMHMFMQDIEEEPELRQ